jgi:protease-4
MASTGPLAPVDNGSGPKLRGLLALLAVAMPAAAAGPARGPAAAAPRLSASEIGPTGGLRLPVPLPLLQDDATALSASPALLGFAGGLHLDLAGELATSGSSSTGRGAFLSLGTASGGHEGGLALGLGRELLHPEGLCTAQAPCAGRTTLGAALRYRWLSLGGSVHWLSSDETRALDGLSAADLGLAARPLPWLSLGLTALDLNGPRVQGAPLPVRWRGSLALRPVAALTLEADALAAVCSGIPGVRCGLSQADLRLSGLWSITPGLSLLGAAGRRAGDDQLSFEAGLQLELGALRLRGGGSGGGPGGTAYGAALVGLSSERYGRTRLQQQLDGSARELDLAQALRPRPSLFGLLASPDPVFQTLALLERLRRDRTLRALVVRGSGAPLHAGLVEELRKEIGLLRQAGKKVVFYLESASDLDYYLATSADRVYATPQAGLAIHGLSATAYFAAAGLDKLGVKAEFFRVGAYKNAPDVFTRSDMSDEQREVFGSLLGDVGSRYVGAVSEGRRVDVARFRTLLDRGLLSARDAVQEGLLDGMVYPDQLEEEVGRLLGTERVSLQKTEIAPPPQRQDEWGQRPRIAVVRIEGEIALEGVPGRGPDLLGVRSTGAREAARRIHEAADDPGVAAILVRIDSPGGDANASDLIWRELWRARKEKGKPVVASMSNLAASGGYYVAVGADAIWAQPSTLTGSIGVFTGLFDASALLGKLGITAATVKTSRSADLFEPGHSLSEDERQMLQASVDAFYRQFVARVAEGRHLGEAQVDALARGRIWTGAQARERGLVDALGGLREALADAKQRAGLGPEDAVELDDEESRREVAAELTLSGVAEALGLPVLPSFGGGQLGVALPAALRALEAPGAPGTVRARMPFELDLR